MRSWAVALGVALVALGVGCRTVPIGPPQSTALPRDLSPVEAEVAVAAFLTVSAEQGPGTQRTALPVYEQLVADPFGAALLQQLRRTRLDARGWFLESWSSPVLVAGFQHRSHYLQVTLTVGDSAVTSEITGSRNLDRAQGEIHENALVWRDRLDASVHDALARALQVKRASPRPL